MMLRGGEMVWDYDLIDEEISESLQKIESQLAAIIHAAIEDITEFELPYDEMIGYSTDELEQISAVPEVSRKCPFCKKQYAEHYWLAQHIAREHPNEAMKKYKDSIEHYYKHPENVGERHQMIAKLFSGQERIYGDRILCPFCEQPYLERELKKHVNQQHGEFMETFYNVLKEG